MIILSEKQDLIQALGKLKDKDRVCLHKDKPFFPLQTCQLAKDKNRKHWP